MNSNQNNNNAGSRLFSIEAELNWPVYNIVIQIGWDQAHERDYAFNCVCLFFKQYNLKMGERMIFQDRSEIIQRTTVMNAEVLYAPTISTFFTIKRNVLIELHSS